MARISVIVPVYKVEQYLCRCIDSILNQTLSDFILILIDDGSPDRCGEICDLYSVKDNRIFVIHQNNKGLSAARNAGIQCVFERGDSEWITFIDSDDWVHPRYLEALYYAAINGNTLISSCTLQRVENYNYPMEDIKWTYSNQKAEDIYTQFNTTAVSYAVARLYKKECFQDIRYPEGKIFEDVATTYKLLLSTDMIAYVPEQLYYYFVNPEGIVHQQWKTSRMDEFDAYEEQLKFLASKKVYKNVYQVVVKDYIRELSYSFFKLRKSDLSKKEKKYYANIISKKARIVILKNRRDLDIKFMENTAIYDTAFPNLMNIYWLFKSVKQKLCK